MNIASRSGASSTAAARRLSPRRLFHLLPAVAGVVTLAQACVIPISDGTPAPASSSNGSTGTGSSGHSSSTATIAGMWTNETLNLANLASSCGTLSLLSAKPDEDLLIAGVVGQGLFARQNGQTTWQPFGGTIPQAMQGANSGRLAWVVYDPTHTANFWISFIYSPASPLLITTNDGLSFQNLAPNTFIHAQSFSVDFTDPARKTILMGAHENDQELNLSQDGGVTWTNLEAALPQGSDCGWPLIINSTTFLTGCDGTGPSAPADGGMLPIGIYRSTDTGKTWTLASAQGQGGASNPLVASDGSIYWASPNAVDLVRSTDNGATWKAVVTTPNLLYPITPIELPDGRIASVGPYQSGSPTVVLSADHGVTWTPASPPISNSVSGLAYSKQQKKFYIWNSDCINATAVPADSVDSFPFDYTKN